MSITELYLEYHKVCDNPCTYEELSLSVVSSRLIDSDKYKGVEVEETMRSLLGALIYLYSHTLDEHIQLANEYTDSNTKLLGVVNGIT
jgi:hypothetical protein